MKFLRSNIFIFFVLGTILSILDWKATNKDNFNRSNTINYVYLTIEFVLLIYIPFFLAIIQNIIIKFLRSEKAKKIFKIIMIIMNILSVIYLLLIALIMYAITTTFYNGPVTTIPLYFV